MTRELTPSEWLNNQLILGQCRIGPEAARDIARNITGQHGFWDIEERRRAHEDQTIRPVLTVLPGGRQHKEKAA